MVPRLATRPRRRPLAARRHGRVLSVLLALGLVIITIMVLNIALGSYPLAPLEVLRTILGGGNPEQDFVVNTLRLPRTFVGFLVGIGMGSAGAVLQGIARNPLAAPDVIGLSGGASLAVVGMIVFAPAAPLFLLPVAAFGGALIATATTYALAWNRGMAPVRFVLVGIGVAAVTYALVTVLLVQSQTLYVSRAMIWMTGSVYGRSWEHVWPLLPWLAVFVPLVLLLARQLDVLQFGDELAQSLGVHVEVQRATLLTASVALAGASVATAGPIAFVGLMAPHIARRLVRPLHVGLIPTSAMVGGLIVLLADLLGRTLFAPIEVPCGVITAVVGAPYFVYLLYHRSTV